MTDEQIIQFLTENRDYFITNDLILSILRSIGWLLVKGLNALLDACRLLYDFTFGLIDITSWPILEDFLAEYSPLIQGIMILSLVALGYMYLFGKNKNHDLLTSILIFAVVFTSSTTIFSTFNSFSTMFKDAVVGGDGIVDGYNLVNQNLYDLIYIDEQIGLSNMTGEAEPPHYPSMTEEDVAMIDITETLSNDKDGLTDNAKDILRKRLEYRIEESKLLDVYNGVLWTDFANTYYYRYQFNYGTFFLTAIAAIIVYLGVSYKNERVVYELFMSRILVTIFSAELSGKRKSVRLLEAIRDGYYALCFTALTLRSYFLFTEYITNSGAGGLMRGIVILLVAFCVVDGANIMEKITGTDAGLSSMAGKLIAGWHAVRGAAMTAQQMRQMNMLKRQTKAMEAMSGNGNGSSMLREGEKGSGFMSDSGNVGNSAEGDDSGGDYQNQSGANEYGQSGNTEASGGNYGDMGDSGEGGYENYSAADNNFGQMDDALSQGDSKAGAADMTENTGPDMGSGSSEDEKSMFDRWSEKASGSNQSEGQVGEVDQHSRRQYSSSGEERRGRANHTGEISQPQSGQNHGAATARGHASERHTGMSNRRSTFDSIAKNARDSDSKKEKE